MRVLSVAFPDMPVGTASSGGAEQVLATLECGLVRQGHESAVVAARGSNFAGRLIEAGSFHTPAADYRQAIERGIHDFDPDLIHFHGLDFYSYLPHSSVPMLATLHLPVSYYPPEIFTQGSCRVQLNCVSRAQAHSSEKTRDLPVISNGVAPGETLENESGRYLLWMGRICQEKGTHIALDVARRLDADLILAGPVHPYDTHRRYFAEQIQPMLDAKRKYVGPVRGIEKDQLMRAAVCVLIPSLVAETSSLVAMESLMCGVPVVAFRAGALPEVVDDGRTGFIVDSAGQMAAAVGKIGSISRRHCRDDARQRFDAGRMIQDYVDLYRSMTTRHLGMG
jgi:glycosyltransferase involved in cell wall biosynthesis